METFLIRIFKYMSLLWLNVRVLLQKHTKKGHVSFCRQILAASLYAF